MILSTDTSGQDHVVRGVLISHPDTPTFEVSLPELQGDHWIAKLRFLNPVIVREFCGSSNRNLKILEKNLGVVLKQNADKVVFRGDTQDTVKQSLHIALQLLDLIEQGNSLHPAEVDQFSRMLLREPEVDLGDLIKETIFVSARKKRIFPRSLRQLTYCKAINHKDLVLVWDLQERGKPFWRWRWPSVLCKKKKSKKSSSVDQRLRQEKN